MVDTSSRRAARALLLGIICLFAPVLVGALGVNESQPNPADPGIRVVVDEGEVAWAIEDPQPGSTVVVVGRLAMYGNEPFTEIAIDTFLDPEGVRERRRYAFVAAGLTPEQLDDPVPPGLVRVRGTVERIPGPGRSGLIRATEIVPLAES